ncbi:MAG: cold shock CspA family protein [Patiriisocius sp.]|jgi:cold shock CspA family protein
MGRSQETFNKKEKEKKRLKKRKDKLAKKQDRKENNSKGVGFDNMISYVNELGHIVDTPPDPADKVEIEAENIVIGIPKKVDFKEDPVKRGRVEFFNDQKGYGFIKEDGTGEKYFVHVNGCKEEIGEGDNVQFELERGMKGMNCVRVSIRKKEPVAPKPVEPKPGEEATTAEVKVEDLAEEKPEES